MYRRITAVISFLLVGMISGAVLHAAEQPAAAAKKADAKPASSSKPATFTVEKGPFKVDVTCKGVFEATQMTPLSIHPEAWTADFRGALATVVKSVPPGMHVHKGDTLVWLDLERIDQAIKDAEAERSLAELAIAQLMKEIPVLEQSIPLELADAQRAKKIADEDLKRFLEVDRPLAEKNAEFAVTNARHHLEYTTEELRQLEKMYRANDIREETEEIVLRRQRHSVQAATFQLKNTEIQRDEKLKVELPRQEQNLQENAKKQTIALEKAQSTLPLQLSQKRLTLEKMRYDQSKAADRLKKLQQDREALHVKSPVDGVVYYGHPTHGQWNSSSSIESKLVPGGFLSPFEVFMTIVQEKPLVVRATVEEKDLHNVSVALQGNIIPTPYPDARLTGKVKEISPVPVSPGNFEAILSLDDSGKNVPPLVAGMACSVKFLPYFKADALLLPSKAVFAEDGNEDEHYVYLWTEKGPQKHRVTIGRQAGDKTEIKDGLKEGDEVLQEKPAKKS